MLDSFERMYVKDLIIEDEVLEQEYDELFFAKNSTQTGNLELSKWNEQYLRGKKEYLLNKKILLFQIFTEFQELLDAGWDNAIDFLDSTILSKNPSYKFLIETYYNCYKIMNNNGDPDEGVCGLIRYNIINIISDVADEFLQQNGRSETINKNWR